MHVGSGHFVFTSQQLNSFFINPGTVSIPLTILSRCVLVSQGCLSGLMGRLRNELTSVPLAIFIFPERATFSSLRQSERKVLSVCYEFLCKYIHSAKKRVFYEWGVYFLSFPSLYNAGRSRSWLEKVKRHLATDSCFTSDKVLLVISLPHFSLISPQMYLWNIASDSYLSAILSTYLLPLCQIFKTRIISL